MACPRPERHRRDWFCKISTGIHKELERVLSFETLGPERGCSLDYLPCAEVTTRAVALERGQATLPDLQISCA